MSVLRDMNVGGDLGFDLGTAQQLVAMVSDNLTPKAIIYEQEKGLPALRAGFGGFIDKAKGALGLSKASPGAVTLYHYEEISDTVGAEYAETPIRGRSQPYIHYTGTGTNKISFTAKITTGVDQFAFTRTTDDVIRDVNLIRSWVYPTYPNTGPMKPPPTLVLIAGDLYRGVPGIIRTAEFTHQRPFNWYHMPMIVDVNIEFEVVYTKPVDREHIRTKGMTDEGGTAQGSTTVLGKAAEKVKDVFAGSGDFDINEAARSANTKVNNPGAM